MSQVPTSNLLFDQTKAGLSCVSASEISSKIASVSKDTKYYSKQKKRSSVIDKEILEFQEKLSNASSVELVFAKEQAESYISSLQSHFDESRTFLHADLDMFFCAVEQLDDPTLKAIPFVVAGDIRHGIVATSNYEARKFGIRSGMATFIAMSLCPNLKIAHFHGNRYTELSKVVHSVFKEYDADYTSLGLDEACLDITPLVSQCQPIDIASKIQKEVFEKSGLTISIGVGPTTQIAKICSNINKPNGIFEAPRGKEALQSFLSALEVRKVPGIGGVSEAILQNLGIKTLGDVILQSGKVWFLFRQRLCRFLFESALGLPQLRPWGQNEEQQSISKEMTFDPTSDLMDLIDIVSQLAVKVAHKLKKMSIACRTITVKFKSSNFQVTSKAFSFDSDTSKTIDIMNASTKILMEEYRSSILHLRLLGVRASNLVYPGEKRQTSIKNWVVKSDTAKEDNEHSSKKTKKKELTLDEHFKRMEEEERHEKPPIELEAMIPLRHTKLGTMHIATFFGKEYISVSEEAKQMKAAQKMKYLKKKASEDSSVQTFLC